MMEHQRIKSPDGVKRLMTELWANHVKGARQNPCRVFMVDLPEPTDKEKRAMAANRANRKPFVLDEETLNRTIYIFEILCTMSKNVLLGLLFVQICVRTSKIRNKSTNFAGQDY